MADNHTIMVKFVRPRENAEFTRMIENWLGKHLVSSKKLFPNMDDEELSTIYEVLVQSSGQPDELVRILQSQKDVEYAHLPSGRNAS